MAKRGRPSLYKPEYAGLARKFCLLGATNDDLARSFDVATSTIGKWLAEEPKFSDAVKEGREEADANVARSLYRRALGYSHKAEKILAVAQGNGAGSTVERHEYTEHYPPDTTAAIFWLKNRRPDKWREKLEVASTVTHDVSNLSDQELDALIARELARAEKAKADPEQLH
jgi:hypothetical protein